MSCIFVSSLINKQAVKKTNKENKQTKGVLLLIAVELSKNTS